LQKQDALAGFVLPRELSMIASYMGRVPVEFSQKKATTADACGAQRPMSQQGGVDSHGHEMHPQELVRLVGCHVNESGNKPGRTAPMPKRDAERLIGSSCPKP
jgi:hypothetical protein